MTDKRLVNVAILSVHRERELFNDLLLSAMIEQFISSDHKPIRIVLS